MRKQLFYRCLLWLAIWAGNMGINRAQSVVLTLGETIELAADSSLEAFRTRNLYLSGYWEFRNYKAERLPSLTLNLTPAQYYHDITRRYDSEADIDVYRTQQSFYAGGNLEIKQNFDWLGGSFYVDTDLGYMRYFGDQTYNQFTSVPIRIGYMQDLIGYNAFRWEKKIEPLKYEKVKKELLYNIEGISEQATNYFFELAMAQVEYDMARENVANSDTDKRPQYPAERRYRLETGDVQSLLIPEYGEGDKYPSAVALTPKGTGYPGRSGFEFGPRE